MLVLVHTRLTTYFLCLAGTCAHARVAGGGERRVANE